MKGKHVQLMIVKRIRNQVLRLPIEPERRRLFRFGQRVRALRFIYFDGAARLARTVNAAGATGSTVSLPRLYRNISRRRVARGNLCVSSFVRQANWVLVRYWANRERDTVSHKVIDKRRDLTNDFRIFWVILNYSRKKIYLEE